MWPCDFVYGCIVLTAILHWLYWLVTHLYLGTAIPLSVRSILYTLSGRICFYWHVVKRIYETFHCLLVGRLEGIRSLNFFTRFWVLSPTVSPSLCIFALNCLHIFFTGSSFDWMGFFWIGKWVRSMWSGFRFYQLGHWNYLTLFLSLYEIRVIITSLIWCVLRSLYLLSWWTASFETTTTLFI
jgi:hypothetical protein